MKKRWIKGTMSLMIGLHLLGACQSETPTPTPQPSSKAESLPKKVIPANYPETSGVIYTWAGSGTIGFNGDGFGLLQSDLYWPIDMTITSEGEAYVLDWNNHRVRHVTKDQTFQTVIGSDFIGDGPLDESDLTQPGAMGTEVNLNHPTHVLALKDGNLLLTAWHNHKLRHYDPKTGLVYTMIGRDPGYTGDNGEFSKALLNQPMMTIYGPDEEDKSTYYILDQRNLVIRKIDGKGIISTVAGNGKDGFSGDGGPPLEASFSWPHGTNPPPAGAIVMDKENRVYISDTGNHRIRRIDFKKNMIETIAGDGEAAFKGDGGPALKASFNTPRDIEIGPDGRLYVADESNHRIRAIDLKTGLIETVAGNGKKDFEGDNGPARGAALNHPNGIAFDKAGHLYIADSYNHRIRRVNMEY